MKNKRTFYIIFFLALIACFLFGLTKAIPGFTEVKLPVLSYVKPFDFVDQEGKHISQKDTDGKVYVAEYFFTTCKGICPKMNNNVKKIYEEFGKEKNFLIMSHTVDPEVDTLSRLKRYADSLGANAQNWHFLTGRKDSLYNAARDSYLLDDPQNNNIKIDQQFLHTQFLALVDKQGRVRKIYDSLKKDELSSLTNDIGELLLEPATSKNL